MRAVNLIPSEQRGGAAVGAGRSGGGAYAVLAMLVGVALLAVLYGSAHKQVTSRQGQAAAIVARAQRAQAAASRLAPYASFIALRDTRTQAVSQLVESRFDWAHVFHEFGRVLPPAISLSSLTGDIAAGAASTTSSSAPAPASSASTAPSSGAASAASASAGAAVASATPSGAVPVFTLSGCATTQDAVALMLERLHLIDGVAEVALQSSTKGTSGGASGAGASGGTCPAGTASFSVDVTFDPLPSVAAASAATARASSSTAANKGGASK